MKSKSIKAVVGVLAAALFHSGAVLAGPGPHDPPKTFPRTYETVIIKEVKPIAKAPCPDDKSHRDGRSTQHRGNRVVQR